MKNIRRGVLLLLIIVMVFTFRYLKKNGEGLLLASHSEVSEEQKPEEASDENRKRDEVEDSSELSADNLEIKIYLDEIDIDGESASLDEAYLLIDEALGQGKGIMLRDEYALADVYEQIVSYLESKGIEESEILQEKIE